MMDQRATTFYQAPPAGDANGTGSVGFLDVNGASPPGGKTLTQRAHTFNAGRPRSESRASQPGFHNSSTNIDGLNLMTSTSDFGATTVDVVGDSGSDSDSDSSYEESPRPVNQMKPTLGFDSPKLSENERQEEIASEMHNAITTCDCNLSKLELSEFPDCDDFQLAVPSLQVLSLSDNNFRSIPNEIVAPLANMVKIDLKNNKLTSLPRALFHLPMLEELLADHNEITELPLGDDTRCVRLRKFGIEWNDIGVFPMELVARCPNLNELFLAENERLVSLPAPEILAHFAKPQLLIKFDNRPLVCQQVFGANWAQTLPWINVTWNKIYPDKVLDFLYLGSLRTAQCVEVYRDLNIGYVLTAGRSLDVKIADGMAHLVLPVDDLPDADMTPLFAEAFDFIDKAKAANRGILIHCFAGLSRSVTVTVAYIMKNLYPMTRDQALALVRESRPAAQPNQGFMKRLLKYEETLRAEHGQ